MTDPASQRLFAELCESAKSAVLVTHVNPDGDAIGSEVGLGRYLASLGIDGRRVALPLDY